MANTLPEFRIHNLPNYVVFWLCRCAELEGTTAEDCARAILERECLRHNEYHREEFEEQSR